VRGWPKNPGQVGPPEGRGNRCTRSLSPSFIGQVHILGILEKSQFISASTWLAVRPDVSRYIAANDDGSLAFDTIHCLFFSTHCSSIAFTNSASIVLTYQERKTNITRWSHSTALCPKHPQAKHVPLNGAHWLQLQANRCGLGAGPSRLGGQRGRPG
jgi:hypothetical protein